MTRFLTTVLRLLVVTIGRTWRVEIVGRENLELARKSAGGIVFALWHARMLPLVWHHRHQGVNIVVSANRDGRYLSSVAGRWGYGIIEGSTSRGAIGALRGVIRALAEGREVAITPDGPRGPARIPKAGVVQAATQARALVVPVTASARWNLRLRSWDRFMVPLPFSRVRIAYSAPWLVVDGEQLDRQLRLLGQRIDGLNARVDWPVRCGRPRLRPLPWLAPLSWTYRLAATLVSSRRARRRRALPLPAVLVGGLTIGGDGKTPVASWLVGRLSERGARPAVLLRDYRGDESRVHEALRPDAPVFCGGDRFAGALRARQGGAGALVLDGGYQRADIAASVTIAAVDCGHLLGSHRVLPAGIWREALSALQRADLVVLTCKGVSGHDVARATAVVRSVTGSDPVVAHLRLSAFSTMDGAALPLPTVAGKRVLACAGIAEPGAFFDQLRTLGALVTEMPLRDHHHFSRKFSKRLVHLSGLVDYVVVTQKDAVKLRRFWPDGLRTLLVADLGVVWEGDGAGQLDRVLDRVVSDSGQMKNDKKAVARRLAI